MIEITDEQRDAVNWLRQVVGGENDFAAERAITILDALPSGLTNPHPVLPTEDGWYADRLGQAWQLVGGQGWALAGESKVMTQDEARINGPFTRLVPERAQITRERIEAEILALRPKEAAQSIFDLVSGTDQ
jgi:hypothetical protein